MLHVLCCVVSNILIAAIFLLTFSLFIIYHLLSAMDPLFWIAHGAIERMFQKATFSGMFSEMQYVSEDHCSGHSATGRKSWLTGYHFTDESVAPQLLTNAELTNILNPTSAEYRDLLHFVYDSSSYDWCANSATWFE